ncbi:MAG: ATP-dependent helicase [Chloroflexi bacterium]|nr:ATP-dependent helicase [Chloroflexota bacterium]
MFRPRRGQQEVLAYRGGLMGVAAVPGSGKTEVLSALAAKLVATSLDEGQEVLIVTLVNSAVDNFTARIRRFLREEYKLLPGMGYRVRTLHGLSHDIVRERPGLVGLADDFAIADEREARGILEDAVYSWLRTHPDLLEMYLSTELEEWRVRVVAKDWWPDEACEVANAFIHRAKDRQWTPEMLRSWLLLRDERLPLAEFCIDVYADYQRSLSYRGKVDFDDLVAYAITALRLDKDYLGRLQYRWPFILEDEAQDSSELQQDLLALLAGPNGRWVRVGDPNQAVYYTFTTANPRLLREFLERPEVQTVEMLESGRSARPIIELANYLLDWTVNEHPLEEARLAFRPQHILPTAEGDAQPNPPDEECRIYFHPGRLTPDGEIRTVVKSLAKWVPAHREQTVAVLVPDNERGFKFAEALRQKGLACVELLNSTGPTRDTAGILEAILMHLADPDNPKRLGPAFLAWHWRERVDKERYLYLTRLSRLLGKCMKVEDYLWPRLGVDWLREQDFSEDDEAFALLAEFREKAQRWHKAAGLPIDQLILTLSQDLFDEPADLARAYHFAVVLRDYSEANPAWRLADLAQELHVIARNERRFIGLSAEDTGFDPERYKGQVVVATMHRAKGLEWDRVHLTAVNNYDFPSGEEIDRYKSERWYVRGDLNLVAEALGQLEALRPGGKPYVEGEPSRKARLEYIRERLRLLYVGITRAKRELIVTWNTGKNERDPKTPALPFTVLRTYWEGTASKKFAALSPQKDEQKEKGGGTHGP